MTHKAIPLILTGILLAIAGGIASSCVKASASSTSARYDYPDVFDISYTPDTLHRCTGWFTDAGAWFGFTSPEKGI